MAQRKFYRKELFVEGRSEKKKKKKGIFLFLKMAGAMAFFALLAVFCLFIYYAGDLPRPEKFTERQFAQSTKLYDSSGEHLLYEMYGEEKRTLVPLEIMPEHLKWAVIATEDANFYQHQGLDFRGITRAVLADLRLWKPAQGASTIPQQLIRSSFLTTEKTIERKVKEVILTLELCRRYPKDQILEWYLNQIPFGSNTYGAEAAAQTFFSRPVKDITLSQAALLSALIQAPSWLSPYGYHQNELIIRKNYVLDRMVEENYISAEEAHAAQEEELEFAKILQPIQAPHFVMYVKKQLEEQYGDDFLKERGLRVFTSLDWELQEAAQMAVADWTEVNEISDAHNAALVSIEPETGRILAMVGSRNWFGESYPEGCTPGLDCLFDPKINVAISSRQPGSAFKPFIYARAFQKGYTPDTIVWDTQTNFGVWGTEPYIPENYDQRYRGPIRLRHSLAQSINVSSVKTLYLAGIDSSIELAKDLGITTLNQDSSFYGLSLVLGGGEVKLLDITSAYGVFANDGLRMPPVAIIKIEDSKGNIIKENKKSPKRILSTQTARLVNSVLSDNDARAPMFGYYSALNIGGFSVAAKTGTTQEFKDAWTIGYSPSVAVGVWVGNNDATPMAERPGVELAGPIWRSFMQDALLKYPKESFQKPEPVVTSKPVLNGVVQGHSILHYVRKDNPQGPAPFNPGLDSQYSAWEKAILDWALGLRK